MVREMYKQYVRPMARVVHGLQASWDSVVAAVYVEDLCRDVVWSPCNRFIAVAKIGTVEIRDAMTLNLISSFKSPSDAMALSFSPDSRFLTQFHHTTMITYDLQTGVEAITAYPEQHIGAELKPPLTYYMDGKLRVAGCFFDLEFKHTLIVTHDLSTTSTHSYRVPDGDVVSPLWTHGEFLRYSTSKSGRITIWQAEFTFTHPPEVVESFTTPDEDEGEEPQEYLFLPMISRLVIVHEDRLSVWDTRDSKLLLKISDAYTYRPSFSSDGRFFGCRLGREDKEGIKIWKESPAGYTIHRELTVEDAGRLLLSPNGESIILSSPSIIRLLHTEDPFLSNDPTLDVDRHTFTLILSPNEALAAFARYPEKVVTILDLQSGNPQLEIDTGMEVECLGVAGDTIVVVDWEKVVTWKLDTKSTRANINDRIRIATFDLSPERGPPIHNLRFHPLSVSSDLSRIIALVLGPNSGLLKIYDVSTGMCLTGVMSTKGALTPLSTRAEFKALT